MQTDNVVFIRIKMFGEVETRTELIVRERSQSGFIAFYSVVWTHR